MPNIIIITTHNYTNTYTQCTYYVIFTAVTNLHRYTNDTSAIESAARAILRYFAETAEEKPLKLRLMGVRMSEFKQEEGEEDGDGEGGAGGPRQRKLDSFFKQGLKKASVIHAYECPICGKEVEAKSEFAFNRDHLERCLEEGGGGGGGGGKAENESEGASCGSSRKEAVTKEESGKERCAFLQLLMQVFFLWVFQKEASFALFFPFFVVVAGSSRAVISDASQR